LIDWNNEDKLFNLLVKKNERSVEFVKSMENIYLAYSTKAKHELRRINNSIAKNHLEHLTDLAAIQI
jgi:octaprenyl-diphosphate synthase